MTTRLAEGLGLGASPRIRPTHGYYRQSNGWITVSPATDTDELRYRREGWEPLPEYGRFDLTTDYGADHPLELLFQAGGAHELPVDQILQMGLYMDPPLVPVCGQALTQEHKRHVPRCWVGAKPVEFPQLAGVELGPYPCVFCGEEKPTPQARDQHMRVAHKTETADIRTGESLAAALVKGLKGTEQAPSGGRYQCGVCGEGFSGIQKLGRHMREHGGEDEE